MFAHGKVLQLKNLKVQKESYFNAKDKFAPENILESLPKIKLKDLRATGLELERGKREPQSKSVGATPNKATSVSHDALPKIPMKVSKHHHKAMYD